MANRHGRWPSLAPEKHNLHPKTASGSQSGVITKQKQQNVVIEGSHLTGKRWRGSRWSLQMWRAPLKLARWTRTFPAASLQMSETTAEQTASWTGSPQELCWYSFNARNSWQPSPKINLTQNFLCHPALFLHVYLFSSRNYFRNNWSTLTDIHLVSGSELRWTLIVTDNLVKVKVSFNSQIC